MTTDEFIYLPSECPRPRVLHVTSSAQIGGTERMLLRFLQRSDRKRFSHSVIAMQPQGPLLDELVRMGVPSDGLASQDPFNRSARKAFLSVLETGEFDIVHAYGLRADVLARGLAHRQQVRGYVSAIRSPDPWRHFYHVWLDRWTARGGRVDLFISNSEAGRQSRIRREKFAPERIITIHNGIDLPAPAQRNGEMSGADRALRIRYRIAANDGPLVAIVSNLRRMKGHLDVIRAIGSLVERFPHIRFLFAGRDDSLGQVEQAAQHAGVHPRIAFCGFVPDPIPLVRLSDLYCMPSHWEGCPTALLEAMAMQKPIVATNVGGIPELVRHEQEALLVPRSNPRALSAAISRLLSNSTEAERLATAAYNRAHESFSLQHMVEAIEGAYLRLVG